MQYDANDMARLWDMLDAALGPACPVKALPNFKSRRPYPLHCGIGYAV